MTRASFVPKNEISLRELFAQRAGRLGYTILESRSVFPDYVLDATASGSSPRRSTGRRTSSATATTSGAAT